MSPGVIVRAEAWRWGWTVGLGFVVVVVPISPRAVPEALNDGSSVLSKSYAACSWCAVGDAETPAGAAATMPSDSAAVVAATRVRRLRGYVDKGSSGR